ncbi:MAG: ATP-dependent DNA helicase RecG [Rectinemataceae bacterium]|nr:ATP-dependent DNA helicase RecG [Spirochaetaceae bacterium]
MVAPNAGCLYTLRVFLRELRQSPSMLRGAGPATLKALASLGIATLGDLLLHLPREYEDRTAAVPLSRFMDRKVYTLARVVRHEWFGAGRMRTLKIFIDDGTTEAALLCFNRPFLEEIAPVGSSVIVHGRFQFRFGEIQSSMFELRHTSNGLQLADHLDPVYPLASGISQASLRKLVSSALSKFADHLEDEVPSALRAQYGFPDKSTAIRHLHFPPDGNAAETARRTLAYEELFYFQLGIALRIRARRARTRVRAPFTGVLARKLLDRLPYSLTPDQHKALEAIVHDLTKPYPMARLLQGDVGSGKTIVALLAALHVVERGGQVAIMAPTELLARQHAQTAAHLLEPLGVRLAFVTGSVQSAARPPLLAAIEEGTIDIAIGTHALFSDDIRFRNLQMVIIDEQQRFGVLQRVALYRKGEVPDLLMMSATPIPRSLALSLFGDLEVTTIRTLPPGRKPVITHLAAETRREEVYEFVRKRLAEGRQAYFVYPVISESDRVGLRDAASMADHLGKRVFAEYKVGLLHSRLPDDEKMEVMAAFAAGSIQVLVATTVVEVGVDVPNATVMVIEHAERFGLSALHQLRGRIGRGAHQGYCFLIYSSTITDDARLRLKALYDTVDGFAIAEEDLKIRGPGELLGTEQSGSLRLRIADLQKDLDLLQHAREDAFALVEKDPDFSSPAAKLVAEVLRRASPFADR